MINYPNGKKNNFVSIKTSESNRGMDLEDDINKTNQYYIDVDKANIHKKPTPIQIVKVDYPSRNKAKITEAYFKIPSTTDYNGVYRAKAIDFEVKECKNKTLFPFMCIHPHQIDHLEKVMHHGAIAFVIIRFTVYNETYLVKASDIVYLYKNSKRKSIPYTWFKDNAYIINYGLTPPIDYLKIVDKVYF